MALNGSRAIDVIIRNLEAKGFGPQSSGQAQWRSRCPIHQGKSRNLSIREETDGTILLHCHHTEAGRPTCNPKDIAAALGMEFRDLFPARPDNPRRKATPSKNGHKNGKANLKPARAHKSPEDAIAGVVKHLGAPSASWIYHELHDGQRFELMRVYRFDLSDGSKEFRPAHASADGWRMGDPPGKLPLYCLPELGGDDTVFVVEGEKCADLVRGLGLMATTSAHGSKSPQKTDWAPLSGKTIIIVPDQDSPGKAYAEAVAGILHGLDPRPEIRILDLPAGAKGDDIEQWLETLPDRWSDADCRNELARLWAAVPPWMPPPPEPKKDPTAPGKDGFNLTEWGNAQRLVKAHGESMRFCHARGCWMIWDGRRWMVDSHAKVWHWAKDMVRRLSTEASAAADPALWEQTLKWSLISEKKKVMQSSIELAVSEPGIGIDPEDLDRNPWLLNCPNGTVDLLTGELKPHARENLLSKLTACDYDPQSDCPRWRSALQMIFDGDEELIGYIQRALGYSICADVSAQSLFLCFGTGRNGKNTVLDTVRALLKDYATVASPRVLLSAGQNDHPAVIADLLGARFVPTSEVDEGERLAESLVKRLTGDSTIKARFMRENWFEFRITFKLWMAVNSKPEIHGTDEGIWRRVKVIPFDMAIPREKVVPNLSEILIREEGPAILAWLVKGCLDWQGGGLQEPERVLSATAAYRVEEDAIADFLDHAATDHRQHPVLSEKARVKTQDLYARYVDWCKLCGERTVLTARKFGSKLTAKGYPLAPSNGVQYRVGIALKDSEAKDKGEGKAF